METNEFAMSLDNTKSAIDRNNTKIKENITGNLEDLKTQNKSSLVSAINEVFLSGSDFKETLADSIASMGGSVIQNPGSASPQDFINALPKAQLLHRVINHYGIITWNYVTHAASAGTINSPAETVTGIQNPVFIIIDATILFRNENNLTYGPANVYLKVQAGQTASTMVTGINGRARRNVILYATLNSDSITFYFSSAMLTTGTVTFKIHARVNYIDVIYSEG